LKTYVRILIAAGCTILLAVSWVIAINSKSTSEKQLVLITEATALMSKGIYIRAVLLLEEAAGYDAAHTRTAESELKRAYLALIDNRGFPRRYTTLLEKQINRRNAEPYLFLEAANYYLNISKSSEALDVLRKGIERTGDIDIINLYESSRYAYEMSRVAYENVTVIYEGTIQVQDDGRWGIADTFGTIIIPCQYEKISTFSRDRAVVRNGNQIYAVDKDDNRIAVPIKSILDFGNLAENRVPMSVEGNWFRATGDFEVGSTGFEEIGMYSGGYAAAKISGRWGVIGFSNDWLIPAEFDEVIQDELGRCYAQGAVFVRSGDQVYLFSNGVFYGEYYEDARPFSNEGYAAVRKNGKWGFIDTNGNEVIPFYFDDALSFGQHLAAVKVGELWGYISLYGYVVIDAIFLDAKSFSGGSAPVLTDRGWQFITLLEFSRGLSL
jgi:tetratricopeptide (TPR) repeat protein